jgi:hypothetical protein
MVSEVQDSSQLCLLGVSIQVCRIDDRGIMAPEGVESTRYIPVVLSGEPLRPLYQVTYAKGSLGHIAGAETGKP